MFLRFIYGCLLQCHSCIHAYPCVRHWHAQSFHTTDNYSVIHFHWHTFISSRSQTVSVVSPGRNRTILIFLPTLTTPRNRKQNGVVKLIFIDNNRMGRCTLRTGRGEILPSYYTWRVNDSSQGTIFKVRFRVVSSHCFRICQLMKLLLTSLAVFFFYF